MARIALHCAALLQIHADRSVPVDGGQVLAGPGLFGVFQQSVLQPLLLNGMGAGEHVFDRADLRNQPHRGLFSHSGHTGDVI